MSAIDYDEATEAKQAIKQPDTGASINKLVSITYRVWGGNDYYDNYPYSQLITSDEAKKLRDSLIALDLG